MNRFLLCFFLFSGVAVSAQYSMDRYHTKENIAQNHVAAYDVIDLKQKADGTMDSVLSETLTFDERGNLVKEQEFIYDQTRFYVYDSLDRQVSGLGLFPGIERVERDTFLYENGLLIKKITFVTDHDEETKDIVLFSYKNDLLAEEKVLYACCSPSSITYRYDGKGRMSEKSYGTMTELFDYDEDGNLVKFRSVEGNGKISVRDEFEYDGNLRIKQRIYSGAEIFPNTIFEMTYDKNGLIRRCNDEIYRYHYRQGF